jgi:PAS domain S-box-containing protein
MKSSNFENINHAEKECLCQAIFNCNFNAILVADDQGQCVEANPAGCELLGLAYSQLIGCSIQAFIQAHFDFSKEWQALLNTGYGTGEFSLIHPNGTVKEIEYHATAHVLPHRHLIILRNITQQKKVQESLKQNQKLLQNILETLPIGVWISDKNGNLTGNQAGQKIWASPKSIDIQDYEQYQAWWSETGTPISPQEWPLFQALNHGESSLNHVLDIQSLDGKRKTILYSVVPLRNESEEIAGAIILNQDITKQQLVEKALWENQRLIQQIAEATPAILYLYDLNEQQNAYSNRRISGVLGYSPAEIEQMGAGFLQRLLHPEDRPKVANSLQQVLMAKDGEILEVEYRLRHHNGEWRWLHSRDTVFTRSSDGTPTQILGTATDITERKQAEAELEQYRHHLEHLVETRTAELREITRKLQAILNNTLEEFALIDKDYTIQAYNQPFYHFVKQHLGKEIYQGDSVHNCTTQRTQSLFFSGFTQALQGKPVHGETQINDTFWIEYHFMPVQELTGEITGVTFSQLEITERKQAEEERDRFFDLSLDILGVCDFEGYFKRLNPAVEQILGYSLKAFQSQPFLTFVHPDDLAKTLEEFKTVKQGKATRDFENRYQCQDGSYKWLAWTAVSILSEGLIYAVARDITERKRVEQALKESQEKYRVLFETFPIGITITDEEGTIIDVNKASETILNVSYQEHTQRKLHSKEWEIYKIDGTILPYEEYPSFIALKENRVIKNAEMGVLKPDGTTCWLSVTAAPIPLQGYGVAVAYLDITERQKTLEALQKSEKKFRTLAENTPDIIVRLDPQLRHIYVNPAIELATGLSPQTFIGKNIQEIYPVFPQKIVEWEKAITQVFTTGTDSILEFDYPTLQGTRSYQTRIVPEFSTDSSVEFILALTRDITELKQASESLQIAQARLEHLLTISPVIIYSCKASGNLDATFISQNLKNQLGYEVEEFLSDSNFWAEHIHPDDREQTLGQVYQLFENNRHIYEYRFLHKDGTYRWMYDDLKVVRDQDGNLLELVGSCLDITERKQAELQLLRLSQAVESASDGIGLADLNGCAIYHNQALITLLGYTADELNSAGGSAIPFADQNVAKDVFNTIKEGNSWIGEVQMYTRQGQLLDILLRGYAIQDSRNHLIGLVNIFTDISERKQAIAALQEREFRFRTLAETIPAAIFICQNHQLRYVNTATETLTGYTREELLTQGIQKIDSKIFQFIQSLANQALDLQNHHPSAKPTSAQQEFQITRKTGETRWVDVSTTLMEFERKPAVLAVAFDITKRKQTEASLQYRVEVETLISEISTHFLNVVSEEIDERINQTLKTLGEFLKVERTYIFLFNDTDALMNNTHEWCAAGIQSHLNRLKNIPFQTFPLLIETIQNLQVVQICDVAEIVEASLAERLELEQQNIQALLIVPILAGGTVVGFIGCDAVHHPITWTQDQITLLKIVGEIFVTAMQRRQFEQQLQQRAADLAASNAELEQFAYIASHDLQEPLRAITAYTQLLAKKYAGQLDPKADQYINFAVEGSQRMQQLIHDLLMYSRVGTRGNAFRPTHFETVLKEALSNLDIAIQESNATITHDPLPTVVGDPTQLVQLLQNLISNAIKYHSQESPKIHIGVEFQTDQWLFWIQDNGIGIDAKHYQRIFLVFQRLHTREEYPGTGIGLAICKKIVERHGGKIWVESSPDQGSTFYFTLMTTNPLSQIP